MGTAPVGAQLLSTLTGALILALPRKSYQSTGPVGAHGLPDPHKACYNTGECVLSILPQPLALTPSLACMR